MTAKILIVSANSKVGAEAARQLLAQGPPVRAGVRDMGKAGELARLELMRTWPQRTGVSTRRRRQPAGATWSEFP